jgi:hypothetical protein
MYFSLYRSGAYKVRLNLWSVFLKVSRIFLQPFPVSLLRSSTQREEGQSLHNLFTKLSMNIPR